MNFSLWFLILQQENPLVHLIYPWVEMRGQARALNVSLWLADGLFTTIWLAESEIFLASIWQHAETGFRIDTGQMALLTNQIEVERISTNQSVRLEHQVEN